jgi:hypothetical protein
MGQHGSSAGGLRQYDAMKHHLRKHARVDTEALHREYDEYLGWQNKRRAAGEKPSEVWTQETYLKFASDMKSVLGIVAIVHHADDASGLPEQLTFAVFKRFFLELFEGQVDLSESLSGPGMPAMRELLLDIPHATTITPADPEVYCPPGQIFHQEWFLIFTHLEVGDLNKVNLACRFFRTTLEKHPPPSWRIARINSLEQRTSTAIGSSLSQVERMRTIVRLEIGVPNLGNMLNNADLQVITDNLRSLRGLKLLFCHLVSSFPKCETLTSLTLWSMEAPVQELVVSYPNLEHLVLSACSWRTANRGEGMSFCSFLLDLPRLNRLALGSFRGLEGELGLMALGERRTLTHLWLQGTVGDNFQKEHRFGLSQKQELELLAAFERLVEYVCTERDADFRGKLSKRVALVNVSSFDTVWEYPQIASYSWRSK